MDTQQFVESLAWIAAARGGNEDDDRPVLRSLLVAPDGDNPPLIAATDTYRLHWTGDAARHGKERTPDGQRTWPEVLLTHEKAGYPALLNVAKQLEKEARRGGYVVNWAKLITEERQEGNRTVRDLLLAEDRFTGIYGEFPCLYCLTGSPPNWQVRFEMTQQFADGLAAVMKSRETAHPHARAQYASRIRLYLTEGRGALVITNAPDYPRMTWRWRELEVEGSFQCVCNARFLLDALSGPWLKQRYPGNTCVMIGQAEALAPIHITHERGLRALVMPMAEEPDNGK